MTLCIFILPGYPFYRLLSQADKLDWLLIALGTLGSIIHGLAQPIGYYLLGVALNAFGNNIDNPDKMVPALKHVSYCLWNICRHIIT